MAAPWTKHDLRYMSKGALLFTPQEVARIQAEVGHRSRSVLRAAD
jgi:hypothetical protein